MTRFSWFVVVGAMLLSACGGIEAPQEPLGSEISAEAGEQEGTVRAMACSSTQIQCSSYTGAYICCDLDQGEMCVQSCGMYGCGPSCEIRTNCPPNYTKCGDNICCGPSGWTCNAAKTGCIRI